MEVPEVATYMQEISAMKDEVQRLTDENKSLLIDKKSLLEQLQEIAGKSEAERGDDARRSQQLEVLQRENATLRAMLSEQESRSRQLA